MDAAPQSPQNFAALLDVARMHLSGQGRQKSAAHALCYLLQAYTQVDDTQRQQILVRDYLSLLKNPAQFRICTASFSHRLG